MFCRNATINFYAQNMTLQTSKRPKNSRILCRHSVYQAPLIAKLAATTFFLACDKVDTEYIFQQLLHEINLRPYSTAYLLAQLPPSICQ